MNSDKTYIGKKVLVVDDEQIAGRLFASNIRDLGFQVDLEHYSPNAITTYFEHGRDYGIVVTDVQMPIRDGIELAEALKHIARQEQWRTPRIYAHTASPGVNEYLRAIQERGIVDFVSSKRDFLKNFRKFLMEL
ncbi:MAG: response regulator [archaeon]